MGQLITIRRLLSSSLERQTFQSNGPFVEPIPRLLLMHTQMNTGKFHDPPIECSIDFQRYKANIVPGK